MLRVASLAIEGVTWPSISGRVGGPVRRLANDVDSGDFGHGACELQMYMPVSVRCSC